MIKGFYIDSIDYIVGKDKNGQALFYWDMKDYNSKQSFSSIEVKPQGGKGNENKTNSKRSK